MNKNFDDEIVQHYRTKVSEPDLRLKYEEFVADIEAAAQHIVRHQWLFHKILEHIADTHGELIFSCEKVYFVRDGTPLTNFGAIPLRIIKKHYLDRTDDYVELFIISQGVSPLIVQVSAKDLGSAQWIENLGIHFIYEKQVTWSLKILIQTMAKLAPVKEEFLYSGWAANGGNFHVMFGKKLCSEEWDEIQAKKFCIHTLQMLGVASHSLTIVLLAIAILSLVHSKMVSRGIYFKGVCCIVAQTQSFKTTLASLFFDLLAGRTADVNFEASMAAIIRTIGNCRDSTIILDDYKPGATKAESKDMLRKFSTVIRLCSDDSGGIKRAGVQNETVTNIAQCLVIVTAEHIHFDVQSTLARTLILETNRKSVNKDQLTYFQKNHAMYRECIEYFIKYIIRQGIDAFCEKLEQRFLQERYTLQTELFDSDVPVDNRTSDMCTWLHIAFSEFLQYALSVKAITQEEFENYMEESKKIFLSLMEQQAERVAELDDVKMFFQGLQVLIDTREVQISELKSRNFGYVAVDSESTIGFRKKGYVYLKNNVAFQKVLSYFQKYGKEFAISETELRKKLESRDYIDLKTENSKKTSIHRLYVVRRHYRCIRFNESKFYNLLRGGKTNGTEDEREISDNWGLHQNAENFLGRGD